MPRYLEDLEPGQAFESGPHTVTQAEIIAFAREFDPQPFHVDPEAAKTSFFGRLVASGWHTAALTSKLLIASNLDLAAGTVGAGTEELRWPSPLAPGDTIHVHVDILDVRVSKSRPEIGIVRTRVRTLREDGTAVQELIASLVVPRRPA